MNYAVVPAAGRSSRLGRDKALLPFGESRVLDMLVGNLRAGGVDRLVVVAAPGDRRLVEHCARKSLDTVVNDRVSDGMLSSVRLGLGALPNDLTAADTVMVCPVDFPALRQDTVSRLLSGLAGSSRQLAVPVFRGRRGHPLVFRADLVAEVHALDPAVGLRALLDSRPYLEVETEDPGVRRDLDTWLDYAALRGS